MLEAASRPQQALTISGIDSQVLRKQGKQASEKLMQIEKTHAWLKCPHCKSRGKLAGKGKRGAPYRCTACGEHSYDLVGRAFVDTIIGFVSGLCLIYAIFSYSWPAVLATFAAVVIGFAVITSCFRPKIRL